jgi:hypothetical protein
VTDDTKDLLTLAAKACGIEHPGGDHSIANDGRLWDCKNLRWWNPLVDDGDGARMEEKLDLHLSWLSAGVSSGPKMTYERFSDHNGNRQAARRWASLRAAAQIGKGMK